jgi:hypothetical protein
MSRMMPLDRVLTEIRMMHRLGAYAPIPELDKPREIYAWQ